LIVALHIADIEPADMLAAVRKIEAKSNLESARRTLQLAIDCYEGQGLTRLALQFAPHVFVRPGELGHAKWEEFDLEAGVWNIPAGKMKMGKAHHVPLSKQALAILKQLHAATGPTGYVFPPVRSRTRPMSENTLNAALRRLGYTSKEMTVHGLRAMAG
jgi:integrase